MPKLCDRCHKNPAVVHVRTIQSDGKHNIMSYCVSCALELLDDDPPPGLKELLAELAGDMETAGARERLSIPEKVFDRLCALASEEMPKRPPEHEACPHCGCTHGEPSKRTLYKCPHCLTVHRREICNEKEYAFTISETSSAAARGLPVICERKYGDDAEHLARLLKCYETSLQEKHLENGVELYREEINAVRRTFAEEMRVHAHPSKDTVKLTEKFLSLPPIRQNGYNGEFQRISWLPTNSALQKKPDDLTPVIQLGYNFFFRRTIVGWPSPKNAVQAHERLRVFLQKDPLFEGGFWNPNDKTLFARNGRVAVDCGSEQPYDLPAYHLKAIFAGGPNEGKELLRQGREFFQRLETRATFLVDPHIGYYVPEYSFYGSGMKVLMTLHLPALATLMGLDKIRRIVATTDSECCVEEDLRFILRQPNGLPAPDGGTDLSRRSGFFILMEREDIGYPLVDRLNALKRTANFLEKLEIRTRLDISGIPMLKESLLDDFSKAYGLLTHARMLSFDDARIAASKIWFAKEMGCFPSMSWDKVFELAAASYLGDEEFVFPLMHWQAPMEPVPDKEILRDYTKPVLSDLDECSEVLWEDQCAIGSRYNANASDIEMAYKPSKKEAKAPFGNPINAQKNKVLAELKGYLGMAFEKLRPDRINPGSLRALMVRSILK